MDEPVHVLHVGADPDAADPVARSLERESERLVVETVRGPDEALDLLDERAVDCVVSGGGRGTDDVEFLEAVRETYPDLPFVQVIGEGCETAGPEAIEAGATDYFRPDRDAEGAAMLADRIESTVDRYRRERSAEQRYRSLFENSAAVIFEEDFSEYKQYLDELQERVDDLETYFEDNPEEIATLLGKVEILDVTDAALDYYEAPTKEALIENLGERFTEEAHEANKEIGLRIANGETQFRVQSVTAVPSGNRKHEIIDVSVPESASDDYSQVYLTVTEITDRVERERELQRQNERLQQFANVVSHDLRNPLQVAKGGLGMLQQESHSEHLDMVERALDRMDELIDDVLTLARQGKTVTDAEPVDLERTATAAWSSIRAPEATLHVEDTHRVEAEPSRLQQLLENLLANAVEHVGPDVTVVVGTLPDGFYVADDGPGIPADRREDVFRSDFSTDEDGTGFGLAIVREIAEAHGWTVSVTDGEDGGARFEVTGVTVTD